MKYRTIEQEHRIAVRRVWAILNGFDPNELEAAIAERAEEIKAEINRVIEASA
jgi:hypothetical protein